VSKLLFESTTGQMQLGKISLVNSIGSKNKEDDVFLRDTDNNSGHIVYNDFQPPLKKFDGYIELTRSAKLDPIISVHELAHYLFTLNDEYIVQNDVRVRVCHNDESTGQCIMEFGRGFGTVLKPDGTLDIPENQPFNRVEKFCFKSHGTASNNPQHNDHGKACWDTITTVFCKAQNPEQLENAERAIDEMEWKILPTSTSYVFSVTSSPLFSAARLLPSVKSAAKTWVELLADSHDRLGFVFGPHVDQTKKLEEINSNQVEELFSFIDNVSIADTTFAESVQLVQRQFEGVDAAYNRVVHLCADDGEVGIPINVDLTTFEQRQIQFHLVTSGKGLLAEKLVSDQLTNKWISISNLIAEARPSRQVAIFYEGQLVQELVNQTPGFSFAQHQVGVLREVPCEPNGDNFDKVRVRNSTRKIEPDERRTNFDENPFGVDIPVFIEQTAEKAIFFLTVPTASETEFSLITPNGEIVSRKSFGGDLSRKSNDVRISQVGLSTAWYEISRIVPGRWIARIKRNEGQDELPFELFTAVQNPNFIVDTQVSVEGGMIEFRCKTTYDRTLDYITVTVDIFEIGADRLKLVSQLVLRRGFNTIQFVETPETTKQEGPSNKSTGWYGASAKLGQGAYRAVFRIFNAGQAVYANRLLRYDGQVPKIEFHEPIPSFTRSCDHPFIVE
jgi:hypothetical protein